MTLRSALTLAALIAWTAAGAVESEPAAGEPWTGTPALTAAPAEVLAAADALQPPEGADVDVLFQELSLAFEGDGRTTWRRHWLYRIVTRRGLDDWSQSEARWSPGYQEKPEIRARVLTPAATAGGEPGVHRLDPGALRFPAADGGPLVAWARLPGVRVGAVVEEEVVVRDARPFSAAGTSGRELLVQPVPVHHGRLILEAPIDLPLRYGVRLAAVEPERELDGGRVRLTFDYRDLPAAAPPPAGLPGDRPRFPHVAYSTGDGWPEVAATLARQIDAAIADSDPRAVLLELGSPRARRDGGVTAEDEVQSERIVDVLRALRSRVTPVEREPGADGLVFASPEAILERGSAGAVDLATLMVAALRAERIPAYLALVRAGFDQDVEAGLPGAGLFNHALVYVPAGPRQAGRPLWIDPSDPFLRAGELPSRCQDRQALIAGLTTRALARTPAALPEDNRTVTRVHVYLAEDGPARFVESSEYHGQAERNQRRLAASLDPDGRRLAYLDYVRSAYRAESLGEVEETFSKDLSAPYRLKLEALAAGRGFTGEEEAAVAVDLRPLLAALPAEFLVASAAVRDDDFVFHEPFVTEWHYWIFPPEKTTPRPVPPDEVLPLGGGSLARSFRVDGDVVYAHFRLDSGPRRLSTQQFAAYREAVQELYTEETLVLWFDRTGKDRKNR